jgi:hypothetical protein
MEETIVIKRPVGRPRKNPIVVRGPRGRPKKFESDEERLKVHRENCAKARLNYFKKHLVTAENMEKFKEWLESKK